jgi:hypothetical protein
VSVLVIGSSLPACAQNTLTFGAAAGLASLTPLHEVQAHVMANSAAAKRVMTAQGSRIGLRSAASGFLLSYVGLLGSNLGGVVRSPTGWWAADGSTKWAGLISVAIAAVLSAPFALPPLMAVGWLGGRLTGWLVGSAAHSRLRTCGVRAYKAALWPDRAAEQLQLRLRLGVAAGAAVIGFGVDLAAPTVWPQQEDGNGHAGDFQWAWSNRPGPDWQPHGEWRRDDDLPRQPQSAAADNTRRRVVISDVPPPDPSPADDGAGRAADHRADTTKQR